MPELPEVETLRRELKPLLVGQKIADLKVLWPKTVSPTPPPQFKKLVVGQKITDVSRRAKVLIIDLTTGHLLVHLKMTGQLIVVSKDKKAKAYGGHPQPGGLDNLPNKFTRAYFSLNNGSTLYFNDMRKFGWIRHYPTNTIDQIFHKTGPEPLSKNFSLEFFRSILKRYPNRNLKQFLLDQTLIAGLGNIYVDEAAFLAKVLPTRKVSSLTPSEIKKLHLAIIAVLKLSISKKGTSAKNYVRSNGEKGGFVPYLNVYGRGKQPCKVCGTPIVKIRLAGRGTHFCPKCQK